MLGPIPYPWLGYLCLAIVWTAGLLCALASVGYARTLASRFRALASLEVGKVANGAGEGGAFAVHEVEQIGRAMDGEPPAIVFSDKQYRSRVHGGTIESAGAERAFEADDGLEIWPDRASQSEAAEVAGDDEIDALYKDARSSKGAARTVAVPFAAGKKVWFVADGKRLTFLSAEDPRAFLSSRVRAHLFFAVAELAILGGLTFLAVRPPAFGPLSTLGGAALVAFFLAVQPIGVAVEEASRLPFSRFLRGTHKRSAPFPGGVVPGRTTTRVETG